jgi:hypothetical protein
MHLLADLNLTRARNKLKVAPTLRVDLSDIEKRTYVIADNKLAKTPAGIS